MKRSKILIFISSILFVLIFSFLILPSGVHTFLGILFEESSLTDLALFEYKYSLISNECNTESLGSLGYIYMNQEQYDKALNYYQKGLQCEEKNFSLNRNIMYLYFLRNEFNKGLYHYEMISSYGYNQNYSLPRGVVDTIIEEKSLEDAIDFCKKYLEMNPNDHVLNEKLNYLKSLRRYRSNN